VPKKKPEKTLEELISRLEEIATTIQAGQIGLEESIELYEEGQQLAKECGARLSGAQKKLEVLSPSLLEAAVGATAEDDSEA
jgi:exodeoxyribonuclease VII small subunit